MHIREKEILDRLSKNNVRISSIQGRTIHFYTPGYYIQEWFVEVSSGSISVEVNPSLDGPFIGVHPNLVIDAHRKPLTFVTPTVEVSIHPTKKGNLELYVSQVQWS